MTVTTINSHLTTGIILGSGNYSATLTVAPSGLVNTTDFAVYGPSGLGTVYVANYGSIHGTSLGVDLFGPAHVTNAASGYISSTGVAVAVRNSANPQNTTIINAGHISGNAIGIYLQNGSLSNTGVIIGNVAGAFLDGASLNNTGVIVGNVAGVALYNGVNAQNSGTILNAGSVGGNTIGAYLYGGTLTNTGRISGGTFAVYGYNAITLNVEAGASFIGKVIDKAGGAILNLEGTNATPFNASSFTGFSNLNFAPGAAWTLEDNLAGLATGETIGGFTIGDALLLEGFSAISESIGNAGLVLSNGAATATLRIANAAFTQNFLISANAGTTAIEFIPLTSLISTISTHVAREVTPGSGYFTAALTVTNTGYVSEIYVGFDVFNGSITNAGNVGTVLMFQNDTLANAGTIAGTPAIEAISLGNRLINTGTIESTSSTNAAIRLGFGGVVQNSGYIFGGGIAIYSQDTNIIINHGSISGTVFLGAGDSLHNTGNISSSSVGVSGGGFLQVSNSGTITGQIDALSISGRQMGNVVNTGTISGKTDGILAGGVSLTNSGLISGGKNEI